jgi:Restriction endonuclease
LVFSNKVLTFTSIIYAIACINELNIIINDHNYGTMDWKEYEEITKHIYETLGKQSGVEIIGYGNSCKIEGKSGVEHQIDILTKHSDGIHSYKTAVECKYWDANINKDIIMKVSAIIEDAHINKGVIVSKLGFTPDAIRFAQYKNIGLIELKEINDDYWKGTIRNIEILMEALSAEITGVELILAPSTKSAIKSGRNNVELLQIKSPLGETKDFLVFAEEFQKEAYKQKGNDEFEKTYPFEDGTIIIYTPTSEEIPIKGLKFKGRLKISRRKIEIKGDDHIWLIMKSVFENKTYIITKDKEIRERKK